MRPCRILGFRWTPTESAGESYAQRLATHQLEQGWKAIIGRRRGVLLLCRDLGRGEIIELPDEMGVIAGRVFKRDSSRLLTAAELSPDVAEQWRASGGEAFAQAYWGNYLAVIHDRGADELHILRDPMGAGACFSAQARCGVFFFTHASDYLAVAESTTFDRDYLAAFLVSPRLVTRRTALADVSELPAGARLSLGRTSQKLSLFWRPVLAGDRAVIGFNDAATRLRQIVERCAKAWASSSGSILHRLSGGLDSSISLGVLARQGARCVAVNEWPRGVPEGDERAMARVVARHFGVPLVELGIGPEDIAYERVLDLEASARPSLSELSFAGRAFADFVEARDFDLLTSGQGGDQVLHRSRTPDIAADAVRDGLGLRELFTVATDTARLGRRPIWDVFAAQFMQGMLRGAADHTSALIADDRLFTPEARGIAQAFWRDHVWMNDVAAAPPARGKRMLRIADLQFYHQPSVLTEAMTNALVLGSQPVVEACLAIAPYVMTQGGRDRALARAAFADMLPAAVRDRSLKGDTTRHFTAVLERNWDFLREILIGGRLMETGLIVESALNSALARAQIASGKAATGLMQCLAAELWLRRLETSRRPQS
jgi:asparagine synthase (glutamine-hydrolysing)